MQRIERQDAAANIQRFNEQSHCRNLIGFSVDFHVSQYDQILLAESRHQLPRSLVLHLRCTSPQSLPIPRYPFQPRPLRLLFCGVPPNRFLNLPYIQPQ